MSDYACSIEPFCMYAHPKSDKFMDIAYQVCAFRQSCRTARYRIISEDEIYEKSYRMFNQLLSGANWWSDENINDCMEKINFDKSMNPDDRDFLLTTLEYMTYTITALNQDETMWNRE